jgi:hypothetical protein
VDLDGPGVVEALRRLVGVREPATDAARGQEHLDVALAVRADRVGELLEQALTGDRPGRRDARAVPELVAGRRRVDAVQGPAVPVMLRSPSISWLRAPSL